MGEISPLRRSLLIGGGAALATAALPFKKSRAQGALKLNVGIASTDPSWCVLHLADKKGLFKEQGLEITITDGQNDARTRQILAAGQVDLALAGSYNALIIGLAGKPADTIVSISKRFSFANMIVHKEDYDAGKFRKVKDLTGQKIGASAPKTGLSMLAAYFVAQAGIKDVEMRYFGDLPSILAGLKSRQAAACMGTLNMVEAAVNQGWGVPIVDVRNDASWREAAGGDGEVPGQTIVALRSTVEAKRKEMQAFVNVWTKATDLAFASSPDQIADVVYDRYKDALERDSLVRQIGYFKATIWSKDNMLTEPEFDRLTKMVALGQMITQEEAAKLRYADSVDMSLVKKARGLT